MVLSIVACGGRIEPSPAATGPGASVPAAPGAGTPSNPSQPIDPSKACKAPPGTELLACDLPLGVALLDGTHALTLDTETQTAKVIEFSNGRSAALVTWNETRRFDVVRKLVRLEKASSGGKPLLYRGMPSAFELVSLEDGRVTTIDSGHVQYLREHSYVLYQSDGSFVTKSYYHSNGKTYVNTVADHAQFYVGQTNMYDDQPADLFASAPTGNKSIVSPQWGLSLGAFAPDLDEVVNAHGDVLYYMTPPQGMQGQTFSRLVSARIDWRTETLREDELYSIPATSPEPRFLAVGVRDLYFSQAGALMQYDKSALGELPPRSLGVSGMVGTPAFYLKAAKSARGEELVVSNLAIPVLDPGAPNRTMIVGRMEPSSEEALR
ncbi:MAG: hypothetical protein U0174_12950 [Polyangiaceae bacterium]